MIKVLGIIPARGGSKGLPKKNIALLAGKPLICHSIAAALSATKLDRVIISTDSNEIKEIARSCGAEAPFLRPTELAQDTTPGIEPIIHAVDWLDKHERYNPDYVMVIQPTSPLRATEDIDNAIKLAKEKQADSVISVCHPDHHPYWTKRITEEGLLTDLFKLDGAYSRRQNLPLAYALNGAIYLVKTDILMRLKTFYTNKTYAYIMPPERSIDIDSTWDLYLAECILKRKK